MGRLGVAFYRRDTLEVARDLLGRTLCRRVGTRRIARGRVVEVEAYDGPDDRASHARRGRTARNSPMFEAGGIAYVYLVYGIHHCLNVVTGARGYPAAILLRAVELADGSRAASGPGRLTRVFAIDRSLDGASFRGPEIWMEQGQPVSDEVVIRTPRIGVDYAGTWAQRDYRFVISNHPAVSRPNSFRHPAVSSNPRRRRTTSME